MILLFEVTFQDMPYIGTGIALLVAAALIVKSFKEIREDGWEPFKKRWITPFKTARLQKAEDRKTLVTLTETCSSMGRKIDEIAKEVKPNGGNSLNDQIKSINDRMENVAARVRHQDETSHLPIFKLASDGKLTYSNCAMRDLIGAEHSEIEYFNYVSRILPDDQGTYLKALETAKTLKIPIDVIVRFRLAGPHFVRVRLQASPDVRHGGELNGFFATASAASEADIHLTDGGGHDGS